MRIDMDTLQQTWPIKLDEVTKLMCNLLLLLIQRRRIT